MRNKTKEQHVKFSKSECKRFLTKLKLKNYTIQLISEGIEICVKEHIHHLDLNMNKIYKLLSAIHGTYKREIEWTMYGEIKDIEDFTKEELLEYNGNLTNKKLFIILLERYGF